jgi:2-C-methyl-D-erythritol 4-phosphate cytidylyltransferase
LINPFVAILPSAGVGKRFKSDKPKQYSLIDNKTIMELSLEPLLDFSECLGICIPVAPEDNYWKSIKALENPKINFIEGGQTRTISVQRAVNYWKRSSIDYQNILIHDSARPCVRSSDIRVMLENFFNDDYDGAVLGSLVSDTLKEINPENLDVIRTVDRKDLWKIFTPQVFEKEIIETVFGKLEEGRAFTDESGMLEESLGKIKAHLGAADNIKITHPEDLNLVKSILIAQGRIFL